MPGVDFRDSGYRKKVFFGHRRVKDGECCAIWSASGKYRLVVGPKRVTVWRSDVRFLDRFTAEAQEYLEIVYRDGRKEHVHGPHALFLDPVVHASMKVHAAIILNAFEAIVVYAEGEQQVKSQHEAHSKIEEEDQYTTKNQVSRRIVRGPIQFVPMATEWVHTFSWHSEDPSEKGHMIRNTRFKKLATLPEQMYYNVKDVRTADDAQLVVKLMVFYKLDDLETMLDSTQDPVGDFIHAVSADVVKFGSQNTLEQFLQRTAELSQLGTFPVLLERARQVGYSISQVVFRGYKGSEQLQAMHDAAIKQRTQLRLDCETEQQRQMTEDLVLAKTAERSTREMEIAAASHQHQMNLDAVSHAARLAQQRDTYNLQEEHQQRDNSVQLAFLQQLKDQGVDLTKYLTTLNQKSEKTIRVETDEANSGKTQVHV